MTDFASFAASTIAELQAQGKLRAAESRKSAASRFIDFMGSHPVPLDGWSDQLMLRFQSWLQAQGLAASTIAYYLSQMCAFYRQAVAQGLVRDGGIFRLVRKSAFAKRTASQLPSTAELRYLRSLSLPKAQAFARDLFLFSLYARGMNFVDIAYLKKTDIAHGLLTYVPHTSNNTPPVTLPWDNAMQEIADRHPSATAYLFPIITKVSPSAASSSSAFPSVSLAASSSEAASSSASAEASSTEAFSSDVSLANADSLEQQRTVYEQIRQCRQNVLRHLRTIGLHHKFSVVPTMAMTKDLYHKLMSEVRVSEVI